MHLAYLGHMLKAYAAPFNTETAKPSNPELSPRPKHPESHGREHRSGVDPSRCGTMTIGCSPSRGYVGPSN